MCLETPCVVESASDFVVCGIPPKLWFPDAVDLSRRRTLGASGAGAPRRRKLCWSISVEDMSCNDLSSERPVRALFQTTDAPTRAIEGPRQTMRFGAAAGRAGWTQYWAQSAQQLVEISPLLVNDDPQIWQASAQTGTDSPDLGSYREKQVQLVQGWPKSSQN